MNYGNGGKDAHGDYTKGTISGQHCLPLMRFCQRFIMWKLGYGIAYFNNLRKNSIFLNETLESGRCDSEILYDELTNEEDDQQFGII
jgi:hypothetical protein